jgi:hypothetical protein
MQILHDYRDVPVALGLSKNPHEKFGLDGKLNADAQFR